MGCAQIKGSISAVNFSDSPATESDKARSKFRARQQPAAAGRRAASVVDSKLGLTEREVYKLKVSWKAVHRKVGETGVEMFISLFKSNQDLQEMFLQFSKLELSDNVRENGELTAHGELVMGILDEAIVNIENIKPTKERIRRAAATHKKFAGFYGKLFWAMEQPFLEAVRITLGDRFNESIARIYARTIRYILEEMEAGFNEAMA